MQPSAALSLNGAKLSIPLIPEMQIKSAACWAAISGTAKIAMRIPLDFIKGLASSKGRTGMGAERLILDGSISKPATITSEQGILHHLWAVFSGPIGQQMLNPYRM